MQHINTHGGVVHMLETSLGPHVWQSIGTRSLYNLSVESSLLYRANKRDHVYDRLGKVSYLGSEFGGGELDPPVPEQPLGSQKYIQVIAYTTQRETHITRLHRHRERDTHITRLHRQLIRLRMLEQGSVVRFLFLRQCFMCMYMVGVYTYTIRLSLRLCPLPTLCVGLEEVDLSEHVSGHHLIDP